MTRPVAKWSNQSQRGFVKGRQGLDNVVDVDTNARILELLASKLDVPAIVLYDYAAAFPSVAHAYLFLCLSAAALAPGLIAFFTALYTDNQVYANIDGTVSWLYAVLSGLLQGCPASGSLFLIAINPCLIMINQTIEPNDLCRAFADDIATVIGRIDTLVKIAQVFEVIKRVSNLAVKANKSVIIPLGGPLNDELKAAVQKFLTDEIPTKG